MLTYEGLRLKLFKPLCTGKFFVKRKIKQHKNNDFTIISNNCWGGMIYESYGLPEQSPTVEMSFMPFD